MKIELDDFQLDAIEEMHNGCVLCGDTGSGKSRTALAYYYKVCGGDVYSFKKKMPSPLDLYVITTAQKRDRLEWEEEFLPFLLSTDKNANAYKNLVVVDSWQNIQKYKSVRGAFFIFDEQRVVGTGVWAKAFLEIAKNNHWILLSATPGDNWTDYQNLFIANGFYKNYKDFEQQHIIYNYRLGFPKVDRILNDYKLRRLKDRVVVYLENERHTEQHHEYIMCRYNKDLYKMVMRDRWDIYKNEPIQNAGVLCYILRHVVNEDPSRIEFVEELSKKKNRFIVFYSFDYELDILKNGHYDKDVAVAEWNGHKHEPIPDTKRWIYLVNYNAGAEGWNCTSTDTIVFYSQNYSYKVMKQASGRIDRRNTPFYDLYYYHLRSSSQIDIAIKRAIDHKKEFNANKFVRTVS